MRSRSNAHGLSDHVMGALAAHEHGEGEFDHDHDEAFLEAGSKAHESVSFVSIGIDIGSSSTQIIFTRLRVRGPGEHRALRGQTKDRETLYMSPIVITPFLDDGLIDEVRLRGTLASAFRAADLTPDDVETGAVILTGEAAKRANAAAIVQLVSEDVGELVCAAVGDHMEAMLSAYGSGAVAASRQGIRILNIDIGGGTTKLAIVHDGRVIATAALAIGGRAIVVDRTNVVTRCDAAGELHAHRVGLSVGKGETAAPAVLALIAKGMADALVLALSGGVVPADVAQMFFTQGIDDFSDIDGVMISGGVGEYVYGRETRDFGDLGRHLGLALRARIDAGALQWPLLPAGECIRATALGASQHSVQLSGQTIFISDHAALLPRRNLPVVQPAFSCRGVIDRDELAAAISEHRARFDLLHSQTPFALAFAWRGPPAYERIRALAEGIVKGMSDVIAQKAPVFIMLEGDVALNLGAVLRDEMQIASEVLVVDGIVLRDFDFVDIGRVRMPSYTLPVTIKSLLFGAGK